jgi:hypothetical protein
MTPSPGGPQPAESPGRLYRVSFSPDVAEFADWFWQRGAGRWDDPRIARMFAETSSDSGHADEERIQEAFMRRVLALEPEDRPYRVLYTAGSRVSAFVEVLQNFRCAARPKSADVVARIKAVEQNANEIPLEPGPRLGIVPLEFLQRYIGELTIEPGAFADIDHVNTVQYLRALLLDEVRQLDCDIQDIHLGVLLGSERRFTQLVSAALHRDERVFWGIHHGSTHGKPNVNWAVFERPGEDRVPRLQTFKVQRIELDDPDLLAALRALRLELEAE